MKEDCWWRESAKRDPPASLENQDTFIADATIEPSISGKLLQSDGSEATPIDLTHWLHSMTKQVNVDNDFLFDSGTAISVCQQSFVDILGMHTPRTWSGTQVSPRSSIFDEWQHDTQFAHARWYQRGR